MVASKSARYGSMVDGSLAKSKYGMVAPYVCNNGYRACL